MFGKFQLTNKGRDLLNRVIAEKKILKFTKFELGKGQPGMDTKQLTALNNKFADFQVTQTSVLPDGITNIKAFYDNKALDTPSKLTEIGVFAQIQDEPLSEVLFSYTSQLDDEAETVPSRESYFSRTFSVMNKTDNATNVTFDLTIRQDKYNFGTLAEMKSADYLEVGDKCVLWGNNSLGDNTFEMYIITGETQPIQLNNQLYAKEYFKAKSGFNKEKTDDYNGNDTNKLFTQKGANDLKKEIDKKQDEIDNTLRTSDKTVSGAINESLYQIYPKEIGSTTIQDDLNNYYAPGFYSSNEYGNLFLNTPEDIGDKKAFHLRVFSFSNRSSYSEQILYSPATKKSYRRFKHDGNDWLPWHKLIDENSGQLTGILGANYKKFPLSTAEVNDICYYAETGKYFVCTIRYSGGNLSMPNSNFEEMSVFINRQKLTPQEIRNVQIINSSFNNNGIYSLGNIIIMNISTSGTGSFNYDDKLLKINISKRIKQCFGTLQGATLTPSVSVMIDPENYLVSRCKDPVSWSTGSLVGVLIGILE